MELDVAVVGNAHALLEVTIQETTSLLFNPLVLYPAVFTPTLLPFTFQSYEGVAPPFTTLEVNDIKVPAHAGLVVVAIVIDGAPLLSTTIVTELEITEPGVAQTALDVSVQVITSPLFKPDEE
jgi:hypothetical protein